MKVIVLGAREGTNNIGQETTEHLRQAYDMTVITDDCYDARTDKYDIPANTQEWGECEALVCTLGCTSMTAFDHVSEDELRQVVWGSLMLPLLAARHYVAERHGEGGKLVFVGSYAHRHPFSTGTAYCAAKAGLDMAVKTLAWELVDKDFLPFIVHPYHVEGTPMWEEVQRGVMEGKDMTREEADAYAYKDLKMPLMKPHEIGDIIGLLLTEPNMRWMAGGNVELFGGTR